MRTDDELRKEIAQHYWWHDMELRPGIITPGHGNVQTMLPYYGIPEDLTGLSVLDIGCWDGFYSFECERRGARRVVASDLWEPAGRGAFDLAREELDSKVMAWETDVYDLNTAYAGRFDVVLFLGVLYHLKHPLLALEKVAAITKPGGLTIIDTIVAPGAGDWPVMIFIPGDEVNEDPTNWWAPNAMAMRHMLHNAGYASVDNTVPLYCGGRSVFHAVKDSDAGCEAQAEKEREERHSHPAPDTPEVQAQLAGGRRLAWHGRLHRPGLGVHLPGGGHGR